MAPVEEIFSGMAGLWTGAKTTAAHMPASLRHQNRYSVPEEMHLAPPTPSGEAASGVGEVATKNRVSDFFEDGVNRAWEIDPQVVEQHLEKTTTDRKTASCVPYWPSRDPIGENWDTGEFNTYAFASNDGLNFVDFLGLFRVSSLNETNLAVAYNEGIIGLAEISALDMALFLKVIEKLEEQRGIRRPWLDPRGGTDGGADEEEEKKKRCCKPCIPIRGTVMHEIAKPGSRTRGRHSKPGHNKGHVKLWVVDQSHYPECKCYWNKNNPFTLENTQTPPPNSIPGGPPQSPPGGGGPM